MRSQFTEAANTGLLIQMEGTKQVVGRGPGMNFDPKRNDKFLQTVPQITHYDIQIPNQRGSNS